MNAYIIYILIFPNNKIYIGQTNNFSKRMSKYKKEPFNKNCKNYNILIYKAIRKYGWNNIKNEILFTTSQELVDELETKMIAEYKSADKRFGYNLEYGGNKNKIVSKETRRKQSILKLGNKNSLGHTHSHETKEKIRQANLGNKNALNHKVSIETREKIRQANLGKKHTDKTKEKIRQANLGNKNALRKT